MNLLKYFCKKKQPIDYELYFNLFENIYLLSPQAFFWINSFTNSPGRYIISHFKDHFFTKYNGLEIVIVDKTMMTYHRLPGAKPDGHGKVEMGTHYISINSMNEKSVSYLRVNKINALDLLIEDVSSHATPDTHYHHLECRSIDRELFIPEFVEIIISGLEWQYRSFMIHANAPDAKLLSLLKNAMLSPIEQRIKMLGARIIALADVTENI